MAGRRRGCGARADFPAPAGPAARRDGSGTLAVNPADAVSGTPIAAGLAANAINVADPAPEPRQVRRRAAAADHLLGHRHARRYVFAQIVDETRNLVLGNQVTPIPVTLDGSRTR